MEIANSTKAGSEVLAFKIGHEEYGVDILKVQELRGYEAVTAIASAPDHVKGVINLRGVIVPVIDMRIKLRLGTATYNDFTVVIILNVHGRTIGMVVDSVSDVIELRPEQIKPAPHMTAAQDTSYLLGLGTLDERMVILVDIDQFIADDHFTPLPELRAAA